MSNERLIKLKEWEAQKPGDAFLKFAIAQEYVSMGNDESAKIYFDLLTLHFPSYLPTYYQLGKLLERTGRNREAEQAYTNGMGVAKSENDSKTFRELNEALGLLQNE